MSIYEALANVMSDVDHVAKRDINQHQKFVFRGIDAVVNAVGPMLRRHKVIVVPQVTSVDYDTVQTSTGKPATACRVLVSYIFWGPDGDCIETSVIGEAWDAGDKAAPKAMSVAFRTALLQALALPTDEPDPDSNTYERASEPVKPPTPVEPPPPLAVAKGRAWKALTALHPTWDQDRKLAETNDALAAINLTVDAATVEDWNGLAEMWTAERGEK